MAICRYFFSETIVFQKNICTFAPPLKNGGTPQWSFGEVAEWSIAAVLKTVVPRGTRGSNPCLSAERYDQLWGVVFIYALLLVILFISFLTLFFSFCNQNYPTG